MEIAERKKCVKKHKIAEITEIKWWVFVCVCELCVSQSCSTTPIGRRDINNSKSSRIQSDEANWKARRHCSKSISIIFLWLFACACPCVPPFILLVLLANKKQIQRQCHHFQWAKWGKIVNVLVSRTESWILKKHFWLMMCSFIILCAAAVSCRLSPVGWWPVRLCVCAFIYHPNEKEEKKNCAKSGIFVNCECRRSRQINSIDGGTMDVARKTRTQQLIYE